MLWFFLFVFLNYNNIYTQVSCLFEFPVSVYKVVLLGLHFLLLWFCFFFFLFFLLFFECLGLMFEFQLWALDSI